MTLLIDIEWNKIETPCSLQFDITLPLNEFIYEIVTSVILFQLISNINKRVFKN